MLSVIAGLIIFAPVQDFTDEDRFGKTVEQMLAMGRDKWHEWYTDGSRGTGSTAGETFAEMTFADGLKQRNAKWRAELSVTEQGFVDRLDRDFTSTVQNSIGVGRAYTGGGTMWNPIGAACTVSQQEAIADVVRPRPNMPHATQSEVWGTWRRAQKVLQDNKSDIDDTAGMSGTNFLQASKMLYEVNGTFNALLPELAKRPAKVKARVFAFFADTIGVINRVGE